MLNFHPLFHAQSSRRPDLTSIRHHAEIEPPMTEHERGIAETKDLEDLSELKRDSQVDAIEEEIMADGTPEGRPPHRETRDFEWRIAIVVIPIILFGPALLVGYFAGPIPALGTLLFALVMVCAAGPVWGAGLLRREEHRHAHQQAEHLSHP
jgi:hypothetical protein